MVALLLHHSSERWEGGREGWREGGREGWREGGKEGGRDGGREGGREGSLLSTQYEGEGRGNETTKDKTEYVVPAHSLRASFLLKLFLSSMTLARIEHIRR